MHLERTATRPPTPMVRLAQGRDGIKRGLQEERIMHVGGREHYGERDARAVDDEVAFTPWLAAVGGIGSGLLAALFAGILAESSAARDQSIFSASAKRWSRVRWSRSQTHARFQSRRRRQHVMPLPHPISRGRGSQPIPLLSTK